MITDKDAERKRKPLSNYMHDLINRFSSIIDIELIYTSVLGFYIYLPRAFSMERIDILLRHIEQIVSSR